MRRAWLQLTHQQQQRMQVLPRRRPTLAPLLSSAAPHWFVHQALLRPCCCTTTVQQRFFGGKKDGGGGDSTHIPYVELPVHRMQLSFTKSSGPGGQNVNKVNTRAEVRFHVPSADWLDADTRARLAEQQKGRMNQAGEFIVTAQEHRTQQRNRAEALEKVRAAVAEAMVEPKERQIRTGIGKHTKELRKDEKRHRAKVKDGRRKVKDW